MQQPRILTRDETLLREPSGSSNLVANAGAWYTLAPRFFDERFDVSAVLLTLVGSNLLSNLDSFCGNPGTLELGVLGYDGYGALRDLSAQCPQVLNSSEDWNAGGHTSTFADAEAGPKRDGSTRVGLRGLPIRALNPPPQPAVWTGPALGLRYGASISAVSWDCWTLRDPAGNTVAPPTIEMRTGVRAGPVGLINFGAYQTIASSAAEIDAGFTDLAAPAAGHVFQLRVTFPYADPATAVTPADSLLYTATLFTLCVWINLRRPRWVFSSLAEIIERSELVRHLAPASWSGGHDVALLRIPLTFALRGRFHESIRARLSTGSSLVVVEIVAQSDLRFETPPR
jgi:hypothetical protein